MYHVLISFESMKRTYEAAPEDGDGVGGGGGGREGGGGGGEGGVQVH